MYLSSVKNLTFPVLCFLFCSVSTEQSSGQTEDTGRELKDPNLGSLISQMNPTGSAEF